MVVCLCSTTIASPAPLSAASAPTVNTNLFQSPNKDGPTSTPAEAIGTVISWMSALLYLGSRLPQLIKNARRRSTEGLSPLLFIAAFCGNLFYSSSMLCNPLAWRAEVGPYGEHGWAPADGSTNVAWIANALPFFLGAAGVLAMDGSVGLQFWLYRTRRQRGSGSGDDDSSSDRFIIVVGDRTSDAGLDRGSSRGSSDSASEPRWRRVSGWMRGWSPGFAALSLLPGTPILGPKRSEAAPAAGATSSDRDNNESERRPLLWSNRALQQQRHQQRREEADGAAAAAAGRGQPQQTGPNADESGTMNKAYGGV